MTLGTSFNLFVHPSPHISFLLLYLAIKGLGLEAVPYCVFACPAWQSPELSWAV